MIAAIRIAVKDLRLRIRDGSALIWGVIAPLGLAIVFSLVLGDVAGGGSLEVTYAVADEDGGELAEQFVALLEQLDSEGVFAVVTVPSAIEAEEMSSTGEAQAAFIVPAGFTETVTGGGEAVITVLGHVDSPIASQVARSLAAQFAGEVDGIAVAVATHFASGGIGSAEQVAHAAADQPTPISLESVGASSKELSAGTFYAAAMAVFFLFFTVQFGVIGLIEEKEQGTMSRLLAAPIRPVSILGGKVLTAFALGVLSMAILVVVTSVLPFMEADWGDPLGVAILIVSGVLAAMGVMMLVAAFARTAESAGSVQAIIAFVLGMLGGAFFPLSQAGGLVERLSLLTPHSWFLRGLGDLNAGGTALDILPEAGYILLFAAITALLASIRLRQTVTL